jgi:diguanylate cyclase (GGDEF)-like protein
MITLNEPLKRRDSTIPMLITAAIISVLFMLIAGGLVYGNTRRTITAADWVEHTQEVLTSLRAASQMSDRVDSSARLYTITSDAGRLDQARTSANFLESNAAHLKALVSDNTDETPNALELTQCSAEVTQEVANLGAGVALPKGPIQRCQQVIARMTEQERRLLTERSKTSQRISIVSLTTDFGFAGFSVLALITLFGFLLRGAELRQRADNQILKTNRDLEESIQLLQDQADESNLLTASRDELQLCVNLDEVYRSAKTGFARLLPAVNGTLSIITNSRNMMEIVSAWGETAMEDCHPPESCCGLRSGQARWREQAVSEIQCGHFKKGGPEYYVCVPVVAHGDTLGLLYLQAADEVGLQSVRQRIGGLRQLVQLVGMSVASMRLRMKLEHQSIRDPLTGLFNRHFMEVALEREISLAARRKNMLAVLMLDVDHFKDFNDTHGHAAGDAVLRAVSEVCQNAVRTEDIACRYGGEEFTIILPDITSEIAYARANSIRNAISALRVSEGKNFYGEVTISIGIALYPDDGTDSDMLLRRADQALYRAKQGGRNQVLLAIESAEPIFAA